MYFSNWLIYQTGESRKSWNWKKVLSFMTKRGILSQCWRYQYFAKYFQSKYIFFQFVRGGSGANCNPSMGNTGFCGTRQSSNSVKPSSGTDSTPSESSTTMFCDICQTKFTLFNRKVSEKLTFSWQFSVKTCEKVVKLCFNEKSHNFSVKSTFLQKKLLKN